MAPYVVTFGEIMLRLSPPGHQRFSQARSFEIVYGGGESNVAVSLSHYGFETQFVTRLPSNDIAQAAINYLRQYGVRTDNIVFGGDRTGIYFLEKGAAQRGSKVIYDRSGSGIATIQPGMINWEQVFADADWFHWTGITPAVSEGAAQTCLEAIKSARTAGVTISCDLNFRSKLWRWGKNPCEVMEELVALSDIVVGNEEDAEKVFGFSAPAINITKDVIDPDQYEIVCLKMKEKFPNVKILGFTLRSSLSATHNRWSGILWKDGKTFVGSIYDIAFIVDRVGAGDSFNAGLIYGLNTYSDDYQRVLDFAIAASALKHSFMGDFNLATVDEVEKIMAGDLSGRVMR